MRLAHVLANPSNDALVVRALGLVASGALILLWAGLRLMPPKIGA